MLMATLRHVSITMLFLMLVNVGDRVRAQSGKKIASAPDRVQRDGGWDIPGRDQAGAVEYSELRSSPDGDFLFNRFLNQKRPLVEVEHFSFTKQGDLSIGATTCIVYEIGGCERGGRTFAYLVVLNPVRVDIHGQRTHVGAVYYFIYVDEDGDGSYETRVNYSSDVP